MLFPLEKFLAVPMQGNMEKVEVSQSVMPVPIMDTGGR
jgi:hypothetical protein